MSPLFQEAEGLLIGKGIDAGPRWILDMPHECNQQARDLLILSVQAEASFLTSLHLNRARHEPFRFCAQVKVGNQVDAAITHRNSDFQASGDKLRDEKVPTAEFCELGITHLFPLRNYTDHSYLERQGNIFN